VCSVGGEIERSEGRTYFGTNEDEGTALCAASDRKMRKKGIINLGQLKMRALRCVQHRREK